MAITKKYDLAVKTGEYKNSQGEVKGRYVNIGSLMDGDNGEFILLNRHFNPAGIPNPENRDTLIVSMFEPKDNSGSRNEPQSEHNQQKANGYQQQKDGGSQSFEDDIPF